MARKSYGQRMKSQIRAQSKRKAVREARESRECSLYFLEHSLAWVFGGSKGIRDRV
jgi:hypothetical protein